MIQRIVVCGFTLAFKIADGYKLADCLKLAHL
jgi:hypothetical protein